jgi:ComF family protein
MFHLILKGLSDLLWPPRCAACLTRLPPQSQDEISSAFCELCGETVVFAESPLCPRCGLPYEGQGTDHLCSSCLASPPQFERARSAVLYGGAAAEALIRFKYGSNPAIAKPLGNMLVPVAKGSGPSDAIVPVPLHPRRLRARGFNQSALLAGYVAAALRVDFRPGFLNRVRDTANQAGLSRAERLANIKGAFEAANRTRIKGKRILLVDDVVTTTATVREASSTLIEAGAESVEVICLARAPGGLFLAPERKNR